MLVVTAYAVIQTTYLHYGSMEEEHTTKKIKRAARIKRRNLVAKNNPYKGHSHRAKVRYSRVAKYKDAHWD